MNPHKVPDAQTLDRLIQETTRTHKPIPVAGETHNAVLVSEEDWRAIQETLYLLSMPGMGESIREGLATRIEDCEFSVGWVEG